MKIVPTLKVDREVMEQKKDSRYVATGWVEIENAIRFPVSVIKYQDKNTGTDKMFVSFPQKKKGDGYDDIVYPKDPEVREDIQNAVLKEVAAQLSRSYGLDLPEVSNVRLSALEEKVTGSVSIKAVASITLCGIEINGITVKEGKHGPFVQMPQRRNKNGEYEDMVYGTGRGMQEKIKEAVLEEYEKVLAERNELKEAHQEASAVSIEDVSNFGTTEPELESMPEATPEPSPAPRPEPYPQQETKITIDNARLEMGYLHFTTHLNGEALDSLFRIYDPTAGADMTLISIGSDMDNPLIRKAWSGIEEGLQQRVQDTYEKLKSQSYGKAPQPVPDSQPRMKM